MGKTRYVFKLKTNPVKIESILHRWLKMEGFKYIEKGKYRFFRAGDSKKNYTYLEYYFYKNDLILFAYVGTYKKSFPLENGMLYSDITVPYRMLLEDLFYCINNPDDVGKIFNKRKVVVNVKSDVSEENKKVDMIETSDKNVTEEIESVKKLEKDNSDNDSVSLVEKETDEEIESCDSDKKKKKIKDRKIKTKKELSSGSLKRRSVASVICFVLGIINFIMTFFGMIMNFLVLLVIYLFGIYGLKSKKSKFSIVGLVLLAISLLIMIIKYKL